MKFASFVPFPGKRGFPGVLLLSVAIMAGGCGVGGRHDDYPLTTCVVCGRSLHEDGPPVQRDFDGTTIKTCNEAHMQEVMQNPPEFLKKIREFQML